MYGYDGDLKDRSARWLRIRIGGLLAADTRTFRHFTPSPKSPQPTPAM